jgi:hypothetical protein
MTIVCYFDIVKMRNLYRIEKDNKILYKGLYSKQEAEVVIAKMQKNNVFDIRTKQQLPGVFGRVTIMIDPAYIFKNLRDIWLDLHEGHKIDRMRLRYLLTMWSKIKHQTTQKVTPEALNILESLIKPKKKVDSIFQK